MADDGSAQAATVWPLVQFQFLVKVDGTEFFFQEVSGLSTEHSVIEYRVGHWSTFSTIKMPGIKKYNNVTMKKGSYKGDLALHNLHETIKLNVYKRVPVIISLLDEAQAPVMTWTLSNAFPSKMTYPDMKADNSAPAIETIEWAFETLTLTSP